MSVLRLAVVPKTHSKSVDELACAAEVTQKSLEVMQLARVHLLHQNRSPVVAAERVLDRVRVIGEVNCSYPTSTP